MRPITMDSLFEIDIVENEFCARDDVYLSNQPRCLLMHPLMHVQLRADGDVTKWLEGAEAWIVEHAARQSRAAARRLDELVEEMNA